MRLTIRNPISGRHRKWSVLQVLKVKFKMKLKGKPKYVILEGGCGGGKTERMRNDTQRNGY